ncbi:universal stress protein [Streptomyces sp. NPDC047928]|uniref:universal stress protein n=1 Tax=unclassified Streptomyces TaxID=2593676 RepID=UPI00371B601E
MSRTVIVGVDGAAESLAAADWAAREALLRGLPLKLLHVWQSWTPAYTQAPLLGSVPAQYTTEGGDAGRITADRTRYWAERIPRETCERLRERHPGLDVSFEQADGRPIAVLDAASLRADVLVLGSRGLSALTGFLMGSVSMSVIAHAERPVVLVRAGTRAEDAFRPAPGGGAPQEGAYRDVVLGLDLAGPCDELIAYAFEAAAARGAALRVLHGWSLPPVFGYDPAGIDPGHSTELEVLRARALSDALNPWRDKYPDVEVIAQCVVGRAADHLVEAANDASLVVVGRRIRRSPVGAHIGPVTHAALHHATTPVAVVPHH